MEATSSFRNLVWSEEGASVVEYSVLVALIVGVTVAIIVVLGGQVRKAFSDFVDKFASAQ